MLGAALALVAAAFFGLNNATTRRGVMRASALQGIAITVPAGIPIFVVFGMIFGGFAAMAAWSLPTYLWMIAAGLVHFVIGRYSSYRATQALGSTLSAPMQQLSLPVALALGVVWLDETITVLRAIGIALVIFGPAVMMRRRQSVTAAGARKGFTPDYAPGLAWGAVSAIGFGVSPVLIALGLASADGGLGDSVAGVLISYGAAAIVVVALATATGGPGYIRRIDATSRGWLLASAVLVALSQLCRYLALAVAPVAVVVPIQRVSIVFRLIFNAILNRDHEVFDGWVVVSILVAMVGAIVLAANTKTVTMLLGLPDGVAAWLATAIL